MNTLFTQDDIVADGGENIAMGYNLYHHGVYALGEDSTGKPIPTLYREPLPNVFIAATMFLHPGIDKTASLQSFKSGKNQKKLKQVNLFWLLLLQIGVGLFVYSLTGNKYLPFLTWFLLLFYFIRFGNFFNDLRTELHGAVMIIWTSYFIYVALKRDSLWLYFGAGICFGLLILTKSVFFYLLTVVVLLLYFATSVSRKLPKFSILFAGALLVVGPWLIRNYIHINEFRLTTRGGLALYDRVLNNQISSEERKAAVYLWGPQIYRAAIDNTWLDVEEVEFELGGKFHALQRAPLIDRHSIQMAMPEKTVSYTGSMRAEFQVLLREFESKGKRGARLAAHDVLKNRSKEWIMDHPFKHSAMSLLFFWRGMWCFPNSTMPLINHTLQTYLNEIVNLLSYSSLFILFCISVMKRDGRILALTILPVLMLLFQAGATQNIPRFSQQAIPSMLICLTLVVYFLMSRIDLKKMQSKYSSG